MKKMKLRILISVSVLVALFSCTKFEVRAPHIDQKEVCFNGPIVSNLTKATGEISGLYPDTESFGVFCLQHAEEFSGWGAGSIYIDGGEFRYKGSLDDEDSDAYGGWAGYPGGYYFPMSGYLSFAAYSPFRAHSTDTPQPDGTGSVSYGAAGLTISDFSIPALPVEQYDLMFSKRIYNMQSSTGVGDGYEGMDLEFQHALSSIKFNVQKKEAYAGDEVKLTGIRLGKVQYKGSFAEGITNETPADFDHDPQWVPTADLHDYYTVFSGSLTITQYGLNNYHNIDQGLMLMPQVLNEGGTTNWDAYITVDYSVNSTEMTATVRLHELTDKWEMGKRYTYNIILQYDKITFGPTADGEGWDDVNVGASIK